MGHHVAGEGVRRDPEGGHHPARRARQSLGAAQEAGLVKVCVVTLAACFAALYTKQHQFCLSQ